MWLWGCSWLETGNRCPPCHQAGYRDLLGEVVYLIIQNGITRPAMGTIKLLDLFVPERPRLEIMFQLTQHKIWRRLCWTGCSDFVPLPHTPIMYSTFFFFHTFTQNGVIWQDIGSSVHMPSACCAKFLDSNIEAYCRKQPLWCMRKYGFWRSYYVSWHHPCHRNASLGSALLWSRSA